MTDFIKVAKPAEWGRLHQPNYHIEMLCIFKCFILIYTIIILYSLQVCNACFDDTIYKWNNGLIP